jgi:homoserine O-succinyltransferase
MPIKIHDDLPAKKILERESIFVIDEHRAASQDIRPLHVIILNLMPTKIETETQLMRMLSNTPLQVKITLLHPQSHTPKNISPEHMEAFYHSFNDIKYKKYDGLIVTGAPVELLPFEEVDYWHELTEILDWSAENVFANLYLCWGAQAALHHHFKIPKYPLPKKMFGVFPHRALKEHEPLLRGFDDEFFVPVSRHTETRRADVEKISQLEILSESAEAGLCLVQTKDRKHVFNTAHLEYDRHTLQREYERDQAKGLKIHLPKNYFPADDAKQNPVMQWRAHAHLFFSNWLNYYVYQATPYELARIGKQ